MKALRSFDHKEVLLRKNGDFFMADTHLRSQFSIEHAKWEKRFRPQKRGYKTVKIPIVLPVLLSLHVVVSYA